MYSFLTRQRVPAETVLFLIHMYLKQIASEFGVDVESEWSSVHPILMIYYVGKTRDGILHVAAT